MCEGCWRTPAPRRGCLRTRIARTWPAANSASAKRLPLLEREAISDEELIAYYEHAVLKPGQPRASIETPLHSMLPFDQVDHTHPDAIIALCAVPEGPDMAQRLWGGRAIWVDYERPGFSLGKKIAMAVRERPDAACVLMAKHGLVTWADTAEAC